MPEEVDEVRQVVIAYVAVTLSSDDLWHGMRVTYLAIDVLSHVSYAKLVPPSICLNILPHKASARIGLIAANNTRRQNCIVHSDIVKLDVLDSDFGYGRTVIQRVQQASGIPTS